MHIPCQSKRVLGFRMNLNGNVQEGYQSCNAVINSLNHLGSRRLRGGMVSGHQNRPLTYTNAFKNVQLSPASIYRSGICAVDAKKENDQVQPVLDRAVMVPGRNPVS